jgi:ribosome biogenesis protein ERB1
MGGPGKRKPIENDSASDDEEDSDFELGLLDDELSSDDDVDDSGDDAESESGENSDDEQEEEEEPTMITSNGKTNGSESEDLLSDASSEYYSSDSDVVLDADGNPRKLLPEIDPHYDSDSSTLSEINTIGNIDLEKYYPDSMPHIGYDINGRRIMRPAAGAALDQLLESIDLPKGWTGIIDKETGGLKNLTQEELEIIKRIRRQELPNDQIEIYDVPPLVDMTNSSHIVFPSKIPFPYPLHPNPNVASSPPNTKQSES